jgi:ubiquinone/menaquinone biosynthesis C-methylase UbiE
VSSAARTFSTSTTVAPVAYLDALSQMPAIRAYKEKMLALLAPARGERVLDIGCGTGEDARGVAAAVAPSGKVVAVDVNPEMIAVARSRTPDALPVTWLVADAHSLPLADRDADAIRIDRVLQHVRDPATVLDEAARVCRPGGRVLVSEPDWGTLVIHAPDDESRHVLAGVTRAMRARIRNPTVGRALPALMARSGLEVAEVIPVCAAFRTLREADAALEILAAITELPQDAGSRSLARRLDAASETGSFCALMSGLVVVARRR